MDDLERYLDAACQGIAGPRALRRQLREELRGHLDEAVSRSRAQGLTEDEARRRAIVEFGEASAVGADLQAVHGRRLTAFLVERAMAWKERAMKTEYRWSLVAGLSAAATLVLAGLFVVFAEMYILPRMQHDYAELGETLPAFAGRIWGVLLPLSLHWYLWLPFFVLAPVVFEWKFRGDTKPLIRVAGGAFAAFAAMMVVVAASIALVVPMALLPGYASAQRIEPTVLRHVDQARAAFAELTHAVEISDWLAAEGASQRLAEALRALDRFPGSAALLALGDGRERLDEVRLHTGRAQEESEQLCDALAQGKREGIAARLSRLRDAFERIRIDTAVQPSPGPDESERRNS